MSYKTFKEISVDIFKDRVVVMNEFDSITIEFDNGDWDNLVESVKQERNK